MENWNGKLKFPTHFPITALSTLRVFHTPNFPQSIFHSPHFLHSSFSTLFIFHTLHFLHSTFPTLRIFHTPHFPHSAFSTLLIFHTPHFPHRIFYTPPFSDSAFSTFAFPYSTEPSATLWAKLYHALVYTRVTFHTSLGEYLYTVPQKALHYRATPVFYYGRKTRTLVCSWFPQLFI